MLWCSSQTAEKMGMKVPFRFNGAELRINDAMPFGEVFFENTRYPEGKKSNRYNFRFEVNFGD